MRFSTMGDLRKFVAQNAALPDELEIIGQAGDYDYPTDVTIKQSTWNEEASEFNGSTPCLLIECSH